MLPRKYIVPRVIEMNYQAGHRLGVNVYLIDGGKDFILIDIGYEDTLGEIVDLIRNMDFSLANCRMIIATHADADHIQAWARAREIFKAPVAAHADCKVALETAEQGIAARTAEQDVIAAAARDVFNDHGFVPSAGEFGGKQPRDNVRRPAGGEVDDDAYRALRVLGGHGGA